MRIYIVQKDDTLYKIAKKHRIEVEEIIKLNPHIANPDYIVPGMKIKLPNKDNYEKNQGKVLEKTNRKEDLKARTNERPLGSVKNMDDRGAWDPQKRITLQKREHSFRRPAIESEKQQQITRSYTGKKANEQIKTYSNRQYVPLDESDRRQAYKQSRPPYLERRHVDDRLYTEQRQRAYKQQHAHNRSYADEGLQMEHRHLHHGQMLPSTHLDQPHFCPCCMYHWHMQESMRQHYNNNEPPKQAQRIYY